MFSTARKDQASVRLKLQPPVAAQVVMEDLSLLGWPEHSDPAKLRWTPSPSRQDVLNLIWCLACCQHVVQCQL